MMTPRTIAVAVASIATVCQSNMANYVGYHYQLRVILIGDSTVGKTSLVHELQEGAGNLEHSLTLGVDYYSKVFHKDDKIVKIQIWDTAGQDRFRSIVKTYYRNAVGGLLVFDVTNEQSFDNVETWLQEAKQYHGNNEHVYVLVGNKCDRGRERVVSQDKGEEFAKKNNMQYIETSAITGANVYEAFDLLVDGVLSGIEEGQIRLRRESWDGVKQGEVLSESMLSSLTNTVGTIDNERQDSRSQNVDYIHSSEQRTKKCTC